MEEKRKYKDRKPGDGQEKWKPEYDAGKNLKEQMDAAAAALKLSNASVTSYLPYQKGVYFPDEASQEKISVGEEQQRRYTAMKRWKADPTEKNFWEVVLAYAGVNFKTYSGLPFSYTVRKGRNGEYTKDSVHAKVYEKLKEYYVKSFDEPEEEKEESEEKKDEK